jgi:hypothetical protein
MISALKNSHVFSNRANVTVLSFTVDEHFGDVGEVTYTFIAISIVVRIKGGAKERGWRQGDEYMQ